MEVNLEILIASFALFFSFISLYQQFFHKEIVVYPGVKNGELYLFIENSGQSLVSNFSVEIINLNEVLSSIRMNADKKKRFKSRNGLNGNAHHTLASKARREVPLGSHLDFSLIEKNDEKFFPILKVRIKYKGFKLSKVFICDYNIYKNEMIDHDVSEQLEKINNTLKAMNKIQSRKEQ